MKQLIKIEVFDDSVPVKLYTIRLLNEDGTEIDTETETNKFLTIYAQSNPKDINLFIKLLEIIQNEGMQPHFLRDERNNECNHLWAFFKDFKNYTPKLRLYCLYYDSNRLILGNGAIKTSGKYQDDQNIKLIAEDLIKLDKVMKDKFKTGELWWSGDELISKSDLIFEIEI